MSHTGSFAAEQAGWQTIFGMADPHAAGKAQQCVVQQVRTIRLPERLQSIDEVIPVRQIDAINLRQFCKILSVVSMVSEFVKALGNSEFRKRTAGTFLANNIADHSSGICFIRQRDQVVHHFRVLVVHKLRRGHVDLIALREVTHTICVDRRFRFNVPLNVTFQLLLHFTNAREILIQFDAILFADLSMQTLCVFHDHIQNAATLTETLFSQFTFFRAIHLEQPVEHHVWIVFGRQRNTVAIPRKCSQVTAKARPTLDTHL